MNALNVSSNGSIRSIDVLLSSSKSESNRVLIINALSGNKAKLNNLSDARDTQTMQRLLSTTEFVKDVLDAGTTMRFLTAYLAMTAEQNEITGTERMKKRPIKVLVDALNTLGANIEYLGEQGFPPLKIRKIVDQKTTKLSIPGNISSQYISALLMIAPRLDQGLVLELTGDIFSKPYIAMTLSLMKKFGVNHDWKGNIIKIDPQEYVANEYTIESDWSGASYWYSVVALSDSGSVKLMGLRKDSYQGDIEIAKIMDSMGVHSSFVEDGVVLTKKNHATELTLDFKTCPDLAQTVLTVAAAKNIKLNITGLESLRIKETDRIAALQNELSKIGAALTETDNTWTLYSNFIITDKLVFDTYEDHRMAMCLAPLALLREITINDPLVVNKSYPNFWEHLEQAGLTVERL